VLPWADLGCALESDAELVVAGPEGPLIRTGVRAPRETIRQLVAQIDAQIERSRDARADRTAIDRLIAHARANG
jgi:hypothetical protein